MSSDRGERRPEPETGCGCGVLAVLVIVSWLAVIGLLYLAARFVAPLLGH